MCARAFGGCGSFGWHKMAARAFGADYIFGMHKMTGGAVWLCGITVPTMEMATATLNVWSCGIG
jgi:hypothetical protein